MPKKESSGLEVLSNVNQVLLSKEASSKLNWQKWLLWGGISVAGSSLLALAAYYGAPSVFTSLTIGALGVVSRFGGHGQALQLSQDGQSLNVLEHDAPFPSESSQSQIVWNKDYQNMLQNEEFVASVGAYIKEKGKDDLNLVEFRESPLTLDYSNKQDFFVENKKVKRAGQTPVIVRNKLNIGVGHTVSLTNEHIEATDQDDDDLSLVFYVENLRNGQFELVSNSGVPIESFVQNQLNGTICFIHDGSNIAPTYDLKATDGSTNSTISRVTVDFASEYIPLNIQEFRVNTRTSYDQKDPDVATMKNGNFIVVFEDENSGDIFGQIFYPNGTKYGPEFHASNTDSQSNACVSPLEEGRAVVVYQDSATNIDGWLINADGTKYGGEFLVGDVGSNYRPSVTLLSNGNFEVSWDDSDSVRSVVFNPDLTVNVTAFTVIDTINNQRYSSTVGLKSDKFAIVYHSDEYSVGFDTYLDIFLNNGTRHCNRITVDKLSYDQVLPDVTELTNENVVVVYQNERSDGSDDIYFKIFNPKNCSLVRDKTLANDYIPDNQIKPCVKGLSTGHFVVGWSGVSSIDSYGVSARVFYNDGNPFSGSFQLNYGRISDEQEDVRATDLGKGRVVFVWESYRQDGSYDGIYAKILRSNFAPNLVINQLTLEEGQTLTITTNELSASDFNDDTNLTYFIYGLQGGQFELESTPGNWINVSNFTNQNVEERKIRFVDDGDENAPFYEVSVTDDSLFSARLPANINFTKVNDPSVLGNHSFAIDEGETLIVTSSMLSATDMDNNNTGIYFNISANQYCHFENTLNLGIPITIFTQQEIIDGQIILVHDGSENAPSFDLSVSDGSLATSPISAIINFSNTNDVPVFLNRNLIISKGETVILSSSILSSTDVDNSDPDLTFTFSDIMHCQIELMVRPGVGIFSCTQQQIVSGDICIVHDGTNFAPSFNVTVSDGNSSTSETPIQVTFVGVTSSPGSSLVGTSSISPTTVTTATASSSFLGTSSVTHPNTTTFPSTDTVTPITTTIATTTTIPTTATTIPMTTTAVTQTSSEFSNTLSSNSQVSTTLEPQESKSNTPLESRSQQINNSNIGLIIGTSIGGIIVLGLCVGGILVAIRIIRKRGEQDIALDDVEAGPSRGEGSAVVRALRVESDAPVREARIASDAARGRPFRVESKAPPVDENLVEKPYVANLPIKKIEDRYFVEVEIKGHQDKINLPIIRRGEFEKYKQIGAGGFGAVWSGVLLDRSIPIAIKKPHTQFWKDEKIVKDIIKEAAVLSMLNHPNVIKIFGVYKTQYEFNIIMEYATTESLDTLLKDESRELPFYPQGLNLAQQIAEGLAFIHSKGIWHRDLKPANLFLFTIDGSFIVKLGDFGEAKIVEKYEKSQNMSKGKGTAFWMAPEILRGNTKYKSEVDVYSFGIILWQLLTRESDPYKGLEYFAVISKVLEGGRPIIPQAYEGGDFARLIRQCWAEDPRARPTMEKVKEKLIKYRACCSPT